MIYFWFVLNTLFVFWNFYLVTQIHPFDPFSSSFILILALFFTSTCWSSRLCLGEEFYSVNVFVLVNICFSLHFALSAMKHFHIHNNSEWEKKLYYRRKSIHKKQEHTHKLPRLSNIIVWNSKPIRCDNLKNVTKLFVLHTVTSQPIHHICVCAFMRTHSPFERRKFGVVYRCRCRCRSQSNDRMNFIRSSKDDQ